MKLSHPALKINDQKAHTLLDRRYAERVPIWCRVSYSGQEGARVVAGEATLKDLSKTGCKILGAAPSPLGSPLTLLLDLKNGQAPIRLTDVTVSWIGRDSFAVRFPKLSAEERRRLQELILKHVRLSSLDDRRTAFRIV
jgi:c-di-GMP-binding flagellar brake protein YcgR